MPFLRAMTLLTFCLAVSGTAHGAASEWQLTDGGKLRLISQVNAADGSIRAGLQIQLKKGWKTYWKVPGDSGLPPQVQFLGSSNVAHAEMKFPVPQMYDDPEGRSIGYKDEVVFPISVKRRTQGAPVTLRAKGVVGICDEICVPVPFDMSVREDGLGGTRMDIASALLKAEEQLPQKSNAVFGVSHVARLGNKRQIVIEANVPVQSGQTNLFVVAPWSWYVSSARLDHREGNRARFVLDADQAPPDDKLVGTRLQVTLVADGRGVEQSLEVAPPKTP